jgi:glutathione S-transferase
MAGYTLYGYPMCGSASVDLALIASGIPHERKDLNPAKGDLQSDDFLAINPRGQVPTLIHPDGSIITEVPAVMLHLADAHPDCGLAPPAGSSARAQHDRWLAFVQSNCYEGALRLMYTDRYTTATDPADIAKVRAAALAYVIRHFNLLANAMEDGPFVMGENPMAVDYVVFIVMAWLDHKQIAQLTEEDLSDLDPKIWQLTKALAARPELKEALARNVEDYYRDVRELPVPGPDDLIAV